MKLQFGELNITPTVENRLDELGYTVADLEVAIADHKSPCDGEPSVYVGTDDYLEFHDELDNFEEAFCGEWNSEEDFARHIVSECYDLEKMMDNLANYFDYEACRRELFMWDYSMGADGHLFRRI